MEGMTRDPPPARCVVHARCSAGIRAALRAIAEELQATAGAKSTRCCFPSSMKRVVIHAPRSACHSSWFGVPVR